jgi:hypothetical protein
MRVSEPVWIALAGVGFGLLAFALAALRRGRDDDRERDSDPAFKLAR